MGSTFISIALFALLFTVTLHYGSKMTLFRGELQENNHDTFDRTLMASIPTDEPGVSTHLTNLQKFSIATSTILAGDSTASGYFYAQYYSKNSNCSGAISYVEGYATGTCLPIQSAAGVQSGSMMQTCLNSGAVHSISSISRLVQIQALKSTLIFPASNSCNYLHILTVQPL